MDGMIPVIVGGVVVAYVAAQQGAPVPTNKPPGGGTYVGLGGSPGQTIPTSVQTQGKVAVGYRTIDIGTILAQGGWSPKNDAKTGSGLITSGGGNWNANTNAQIQQVLDTAESYGEAAYNNLDDAARAKGAAVLNEQLKIDPPLTGKEDWHEMGAKVGAYAGSEGANAACEAGGIPPICGPLGDKLGAYLGADIGDWLHDNSDGVKNWFRARWQGIDNWVMGLANDVENKANEYYDDVKNYVGGLF